MKKRRIVICAVQVPFARGGAEIVIDELSRQLKAKGNEVEIAQIPFSFSPKSELITNCVCWRMLNLKDLTGSIPDVVIATKFPSYVIKHPDKIVWLFHQHRSAYDLFDTPMSDFKNDDEGIYYKNLITRIDNTTLNEAKKIFTLSKRVSDRLEKYNNIDSEPLYAPLHSNREMLSGEYGDYILYVGRLNLTKRVNLLLEALAATENKINCRIIGEGDEEHKLKKLVKKLGISDRVEFLGYVPPDSVIVHYARCFAVFFAPKDEDFGIITMEAFASNRPVITCSDSGGPLELIKDGINGIVCEPDPDILAKAIDRLYSDRALCWRLGEFGGNSIKSINWENTITKLEEYF